jgi:hypothetical protein
MPVPQLCGRCNAVHNLRGADTQNTEYLQRKDLNYRNDTGHHVRNLHIKQNLTNSHYKIHTPATEKNDVHKVVSDFLLCYYVFSIIALFL